MNGAQHLNPICPLHGKKTDEGDFDCSFYVCEECTKGMDFMTLEEKFLEVRKAFRLVLADMTRDECISLMSDIVARIQYIDNLEILKRTGCHAN